MRASALSDLWTGRPVGGASRSALSIRCDSEVTRSAEPHRCSPLTGGLTLSVARSDQQGQARAAPARCSVSRPLSCGDHHLTAAGAEYPVVFDEQLASPPGGSPGADVGLDDRLVLQRRDVSWLGGVRRRAIPVARPCDVRSAPGLPAPDLVAERRLEESRDDLVSRGPRGAAVILCARRAAAGRHTPSTGLREQHADRVRLTRSQFLADGCSRCSQTSGWGSARAGSLDAKRCGRPGSSGRSCGTTLAEPTPEVWQPQRPHGRVAENRLRSFASCIRHTTTATATLTSAIANPTITSTIDTSNG